MISDKANPWHKLAIQDYESHMGHPTVAQLQMLNRIIKEQLETIVERKKSDAAVSILGITNGNGLEHIASLPIGKVIGIDINKAFLEVCLQRFGYLKSRLVLKQMDLVEEKALAISVLQECNLIIANLVIEHIHLDNFIAIIRELPKHNQSVSCVIQYNPDGTLASASGNEHAFDDILTIFQEVNEQDLTASMAEIGYLPHIRKDYILPNGKQFIRLDFTAV